MNRRLLVLSLFLVAVSLALTGCGGEGVPPGATGAIAGGALTVQLTKAPPSTIVAGQQVGLVATVFNDKNNAGVNWSCTPASACGSFSPGQTGYEIDTLYTAPVAPANGPITPNLAYTVTITATSVADSSQSASATITVDQQYGFVQEGYGSWGVIGSVTLDVNGSVAGGEVDFSCSDPAAYCAPGGANFKVCPTSSGTCGNSVPSGYTIDSTGHGKLTLSITNCCVQTSSITFTSNSHAVIAEDDQFSGLTFGGVGSLDLQTEEPELSPLQLSGGYSFTLNGYSGANGASASWGGVFAADGAGNITNGTFDENFGGGSGYNSVSFTGTYTSPDANGRGTMTLSATPDTPACGASPLPTCTEYVYYVVTPQVIRLTTASNYGNAAGTGSAYGQGSLSGTAGTDAALTGNFIFSEYGFTSNTNGGESGAAAGQFNTDGAGHITAGIMDLNAFGTLSTIDLAGSTYSISGAPRGTITGPSGQTYNVYLTDPSLNLLDPNNTSGTGGALLLETDAVDTIGLVIPQTDTAATLSGDYVVFLSDQSNPPNSDGGFTGDFATSSATLGTFTGEGDFQGAGTASATPVVGPLSGTFSADTANPGRFTGTITTEPAFPNDTPPASPDSPGTEDASFYLANGSQGFIVETDSIAPIFGVVEAQGAVTGTAAAKRKPAQQQHTHPKNLLQTIKEQHSRLSSQLGSGHE